MKKKRKRKRAELPPSAVRQALSPESSSLSHVTPRDLTQALGGWREGQLIRRRCGLEGPCGIPRIENRGVSGEICHPRGLAGKATINLQSGDAHPIAAPGEAEAIVRRNMDLIHGRRREGFAFPGLWPRGLRSNRTTFSIAERARMHGTCYRIFMQHDAIRRSTQMRRHESCWHLEAGVGTPWHRLWLQLA